MGELEGPLIAHGERVCVLAVAQETRGVGNSARHTVSSPFLTSWILQGLVRVVVAEVESTEPVIHPLDSAERVGHTVGTVAGRTEPSDLTGRLTLEVARMVFRR